MDTTPQRLEADRKFLTAFVYASGVIIVTTAVFILASVVMLLNG